MDIGFNEIQKLTELFNPKKNDSDSEDETQECEDNTDIIGPSGDNAEPKQKKLNPYSKIERDEKAKNEILDEETFLDEQEHKTERDWKKTPVWDISYKQQVTASDVFLQMGFKNPTTSSCEDMLVTISLPGDSHFNMDLKIHKENLILVSPRHYLDLKLPHPVDPQQGNAKWDSAEEKLIVTLRMDRELDLVNF
ncbi:unnamed protein product [Psylliodes chrysocephalus]|uniref:PIH1D1/2/3 CS-like domain-containing protein n=1 Tax=Psylliodes chrysocephalus TaxID=3402493 RepID=A0A9P0D1Z0_9CUCU|nr:unnamed protein product [Psylliodes chrysocephala]